MNKNATPIILLILAIGIYFTFTNGRLEELKAIKLVNVGYEEALANSEKLIKVRDTVRDNYNKIDPKDRTKLEKMVPDNVDNVRLIIDANGIAAKRGLSIKNVKTSATNLLSDENTERFQTFNSNPTLDTVTLSFGVSTNYQTFINLLKDIEASLRIMDITKITLQAGEGQNYDYGVEIKTYWLKQ